MTRVEKNLTVAAWCLTVAFLTLVIIWPMTHRAQSQAAGPLVINTANEGSADTLTGDPQDLSGLPVIFAAPAFQLTNQLGKPFGSGDLHRHPYIVDFIYTTCQTACPRMSANVQDLVNKVPADVRFVSFTVDPEHDDVKALADYAKFYGADPARWIFVTGTKDEILKEEGGMKVVNLAAPINPLMHSEILFLVDGQGQVRLLAQSDDSHDIKRLIDGAEALSTNAPTTQAGDTVTDSSVTTRPVQTAAGALP